MSERPRLILIGSGDQASQEPVLAALADHYELALIERDYPTWQKSYVSTHRITAISDVAVLFSAVADLRGEVAVAGVLTLDPRALPAAGEVTRKLGLRHLSADAARTCRDAYALHTALRDAALPDVQFHLARTEEDAVSAAEAAGFPVLLRPRLRPEAAGATVARDMESLREAFRQLTPPRPVSATPAEAVIEEFPDGFDLSVHSVVTGGLARVVTVARGEPWTNPAGETAGELVVAWQDEPWADAILNLVEAGQRAVGADWGVTRTEVRVTGQGPRILAINPGLAGDLAAVKAATGVDLAAAAAAIAFDRQPELTTVSDLDVTARQC